MMKTYLALTIALILTVAAGPAFAVSQFYVWQDLDGDNVKDVIVGTISAYSGALNAVDNYDYFSASGHPVSGPSPEDYKSKIWLYEGPDGLSFNMLHNIDASGNNYWNHVVWDISVTGTSSSVLLSDDSPELATTGLIPDGTGYLGNWAYIRNTDGGVIGHLTGWAWEIMIDPAEFGDVRTWDAYSAMGGFVPLWTNPDPLPVGLGTADHYRQVTGAYTTFITPVPEPGTLLLLGAGLAGLGAARRRRR